MVLAVTQQSMELALPSHYHDAHQSVSEEYDGDRSNNWGAGKFWSRKTACHWQATVQECVRLRVLKGLASATCTKVLCPVIIAQHIKPCEER